MTTKFTLSVIEETFNARPVNYPDIRVDTNRDITFIFEGDDGSKISISGNTKHIDFSAELKAHKISIKSEESNAVSKMKDKETYISPFSGKEV